VVSLRFHVVEGGSAALDFGDDVVSGGFPDDGFGVGVPLGGPGGDGFGEVSDAGEGASTKWCVGEFFEPSFDQVQPGTRGRGVVQVPATRSLCASHFAISGVE
jgi:hypothetical protein